MELTQEFLILVPITVGLVQVAKKTGLDSRYAPLFSVFVACGMSVILSHGLDAIAQGIIAGLTASGLWSGVKTTMK